MSLAESDLDPDKHYLYRYFNAEGELLYVGRSVSPLIRFRVGHSAKDWRNQVAVVDLEEHDTHEHVVAAESAAIAAENPRHNIAGTRRSAGRRRGGVEAKTASNPPPSNWLTFPGHLAFELREARQRSFPAQHDLAAHMGWSTSKVSRAEAGVTMLPPLDVVAWADACNADAGRLSQLRTAAEEASKEEMPPVDWVRMLEASEHVAMVDNRGIPAPLQTDEYRERLLATDDWTAHADMPPIVTFDQLPSCAVVLTDTALLRSACSAEAMVEQLDRLILYAEHSHVDLHVIPHRPGTKVPPIVPFHIYSPLSVVRSELNMGNWWSNEINTVLTHHRVLERLISASLVGDEAIDRVRWARDRHAEGWD